MCGQTECPSRNSIERFWRHQEKEGKKDAEELPRGLPKSAAHEVSADNEGGRRSRTSEGTAAKKTAFCQACCRSVGEAALGSDSWSSAPFTDVDQERRRRKHDEVNHFFRHSSQR